MNRLSYMEKLYNMSTTNGSIEGLITKLNLYGLSGTSNQNISITIRKPEVPIYTPYIRKSSTTSS